MKKNIGFEIKMNENEKVKVFDLPKETSEYLNSLIPEKNHTYYLKEFLVYEKNYNNAMDALHNSMEDSLPEKVKSQCKYCNGLSNDKSDKNCIKHTMQMQFTFVVAANEFINLVFRNRFIYNNKPNLLKLTAEFFYCFRFINGKGLMYFDLEKLCRTALNFGFLSLSDLFAKSEIFQAHSIINDTLDSINDEDLQNKVLQREDENYLDLQKEFFENKLRYYKEKIFVEEKQKSLNPKKRSKSEKTKEPSIPHYVLYYYYLQTNGYFGYFENHPKGKVKAIEELINNEGIDTTVKYFQIAYNKIAHHKTNRVAKNQVPNIDFVANKMLKGFPKAQKEAQQELREAKTKNR